MEVCQRSFSLINLAAYFKDDGNFITFRIQWHRKGNKDQEKQEKGDWRNLKNMDGETCNADFWSARHCNTWYFTRTSYAPLTIFSTLIVVFIKWLLRWDISDDFRVLVSVHTEPSPPVSTTNKPPTIKAKAKHCFHFPRFWTCNLCGGFCCKVDEITEVILSNQVGIAILVETWLHVNIPDSLAIIPGYV